MKEQHLVLLKEVIGQLLSLNIQFLNVKNSDFSLMDLGLRHNFQNSQQLYATLAQTVRENLAPGELLHFQDVFFHYVLFYTREDMLCSIGPFLTLSPAELPTGFQYMNTLHDYIERIPQLAYDRVEAAAVQIMAAQGYPHPILRNYRQPAPSRLLLASSADSSVKPVLAAESSLSTPIQKTLQYIRTHLSGKLSLDIMADHLGFSATYLSHKFKEELGVAPMQYVIRLRMEAARQQLRLTDRDIQQIAASVGITDLSYFSKLFRQNTGMSPSQFRQLNR